MLNLLRKIYSKIKANPLYIYLLLYFLFLVTLSFFRNTSADETYYLKETVLIAELFKRGIWIGDYGVGLHGILFKLPAALAFIILGRPSVFIATLFTIIFNVSSLFLFYRIVKRFFLKGNFAIWATILLSVAFHFLETTVSFNRDIPAVFTVLLFVYLFLKNSNIWMIGLSLLLMLDAKEHIFFTVAPAYFIYLLINSLSRMKTVKIWENLKEFCVKCFSGYFFSLVWLVLMFCTSIVPMNMFVASILGFTDGGLAWSASQFSIDAASQNLMYEGGKEITKLSDIDFLNTVANCPQKEEVGSVESSATVAETVTSEKNENICESVLCKIINIGDVLLSYIGKILYPRTFSFISIPKIMAFPATIYAFSLLITWLKKKDKRVILPIALLLNVLIVVLRASHGRYLLCVTPIFVLFFVMFIKNCTDKPRFFRNTLIATTIFVLLGLLFESTFLLPKIILEVGLLLLLWLVFLLRTKNKKWLGYAKQLLFWGLASGMFFSFLASSYSIGQISSYIKYGKNRGTDEIVAEIPTEERIWINNYGSDDLVSVLRGNTFNEPEWYWELADWIPKKSLLKTYGTNNTLSFNFVTMEDFQEQIEKNHVQKVVLAVSMIKGEEAPWNNYVEEFASQEWLKLDKTLNLKNKVVYIYDVEN